MKVIEYTFVQLNKTDYSKFPPLPRPIWRMTKKEVAR